MKKQTTILWLGAFLLTFLLGYIKSVTGQYFPISGTTGIEGERVTYRFEKRAHIKDTLDIFVRTDLNGLGGKIRMLSPGYDSVCIPFFPVENGKMLKARVPVKNVPGSVLYRASLQYKGTEYKIPADGSAVATFCVPVVPVSLMSVYFFTLYFGLMLSLRIGLEYFSEGRAVKKLSMFALTFFALYGLLFVPVVNLFELGAVNKMAPSPGQMFIPSDLSLFAVWIIAVITFFNSKDPRRAAAVFALITIILFYII